MDKNILQKIERGQDSICLTCIHRMVCRAIDNQPCTKCSHYQDAENSGHGRIIETIENGKMHRECSCCGCDLTAMTSWCVPVFCPSCGAALDQKMGKEEV